MFSSEELKQKMQTAFDTLQQEIQQKNTATGLNDINMANARGLTLLHIACALGNMQIIEKLVIEGADLNAKALVHGNPRGPTPIEFSAAYEQKDAVYCLMTHGAELSVDMLKNQSNPDWFNHFIKEKLRNKLNNHDTQNITNASLMRELLITAIAIGDFNYFETYEIKSPLFFQGTLKFYGDDLLLAAAEYGQAEVFGKLISKYNISLYPKMGENPVFSAAKFDKWDVVREALSKKDDKNSFDINYQNPQKDSLLLSAAAAGAKCVIEIIKQPNVDLTIVNGEQKTFLHLLFGRPGNNQLLQEILHSIDEDLLNKLCSVQDMYGETPEQLASQNGYMNLLNAKIEYSYKESTAAAISVDQGVLMHKINRYLSLKPNSDIAFSNGGYCVGYSILLSLLGSEIFFKIVELFNSWDGTADSLFNKIEFQGFTNLDDLFNEFTRCITWAQHPWIALTSEININKVLEKFNINYQVFGEVEIDTSKVSDTQAILELIQSLPPNVKILLLGDGHACRVETLENHSLNYHDPNFKKRMPNLQDINQLQKILVDTKFSKAKFGSETSFIFVAYGNDLNYVNVDGISKQIVSFKYLHPKKESLSNIGFIKDKNNLSEAPVYKEEEVFNKTPPKLNRFLFDEKKLKIIPK